MKSTKAMRDRCRELANPEQDDYDRAVICIIDHLESILEAPDPSSNEVLGLVALLRQIDQLLYKVSQSPDWETMRPHITALCEGMYDRMRAESDRIRMVMIPQIREAYLNAAPQVNPTQDRHPQLEGSGHAGQSKVPDAQRDEEHDS